MVQATWANKHARPPSPSSSSPLSWLWSSGRGRGSGAPGSGRGQRRSGGGGGSRFPNASWARGCCDRANWQKALDVYSTLLYYCSLLIDKYLVYSRGSLSSRCSMQGTATDRPAAAAGLTDSSGNGESRLQGCREGGLQGSRAPGLGRAGSRSYDLDAAGDGLHRRRRQRQRDNDEDEDMCPRHGMTWLHSRWNIAADVPHMAVARASRLTPHASRPTPQCKSHQPARPLSFIGQAPSKPASATAAS